VADYGTASTSVWPTWVSTSYTVTGTSSTAWSAWTSVPVTTANTVWTMWGSASTTTTGTVNGYVWTYWVGNPPSPVVPAVQVECQDAHVKSWEKMLAEWETALWEYKSWTAGEAERVAEKLLVANLSKEQREQHKKERQFFVRSQSGRMYRVRTGATHGNVCLVDPATKEDLAFFCVQPGGVPKHDANLAQKLYLEHAEDHFLAKANMTPIRHDHPEVKRFVADRDAVRRRAA
jgi:hypothetical protein